MGVSGGLDSTLALLVTVRAFDSLNIDRKNIIAVTMPCFGTTDRTYNNAVKDVYKRQINKLLNRKSLARVSGTPGKTITINFYNIDDTIYLVDLPGYGYAQRSKSETCLLYTSRCV